MGPLVSMRGHHETRHCCVAHDHVDSSDHLFSTCYMPDTMLVTGTRTLLSLSTNHMRLMLLQSSVAVWMVEIKRGMIKPNYRDLGYHGISRWTEPADMGKFKA